MKDKKKIGWTLLEVLGEIVLASLSFGIGVLIVSLFGVDFESSNIDDNLIALLGIAVFFVVFGMIRAFVRWIKKILRGKRN